MNPIVFALRHPITTLMLVVSLVGGAERELAAGPAAAGRGLLAAGVQDAADPRDRGVHREPGTARLLVTPADQR